MNVSQATPKYFMIIKASLKIIKREKLTKSVSFNKNVHLSKQQPINQNKHKFYNKHFV